MPLMIDNKIAEQALNMEDAIGAMESALRQLAEGDAVYQPRTDLWSPTATVGDYFRWGSLLGAIKDPPVLAFRFKLDIMTWQEYNGAVTEHWFNVEPGKYCGIILLVDTRTGELLCIMNDGYLQSYRVGATAGVGVKHLSRPDSRVMGVLGSGAMARTYAMATCAVRPIEHIKIFSPTPANREKYAEKMAEALGIKVTAVKLRPRSHERRRHRRHLHGLARPAVPGRLAPERHARGGRAPPRSWKPTPTRRPTSSSAPPTKPCSTMPSEPRRNGTGGPSTTTTCGATPTGTTPPCPRC